MYVSDLNLMKRFTRQPRVLGTRCRYVPMNKLLHTPGLEYGETVRIVSYPDCKEDLFIGVVEARLFRSDELKGSSTVSKEFISAQGFPEDVIKFVMWRDLAQ